MRIKEEWKRPVTSSDAWKAILFAVVLLAVILAFGPVIFQSRFERLGWAVLLLVFWARMAKPLVKYGWRVLPNSHGVLFVGYTFFAGGDVLPHGTAASWLTAIGALLIMGASISALVDFRKTKQSASTDAAPPV